MREYLFVHECVGVIPEQTGFSWIWWCPGQKTEEGWEHYPEGVSSQMVGMPLHYLRDPKEISIDLQRVWLKHYLARRIYRQNAKSDKTLLLDQLRNDLGFRFNQAMLLSKTYLGASIATIISSFRHNCSSYEIALHRGGDRLTETIRVHRELIEIMGVYRKYKDEILAFSDSEFEYHRNLAQLSHDAIIAEALKIINQRRKAEAGSR